GRPGWFGMAPPPVAPGTSPVTDHDCATPARVAAGCTGSGQTERVTSTVRAAIRVEGVVQGVGFRPFVYSLATRLGLAGWVGNDSGGVFAEVEGPAESVRDFLESVRRDAPPLARVDRVTAEPMTPDGAAGFAIVPSDGTGRRRALVSA